MLLGVATPPTRCGHGFPSHCAPGTSRGWPSALAVGCRQSPGWAARPRPVVVAAGPWMPLMLKPHPCPCDCARRQEGGRFGRSGDKHQQLRGVLPLAGPKRLFSVARQAVSAAQPSFPRGPAPLPGHPLPRWVPWGAPCAGLVSVCPPLLLSLQQPPSCPWGSLLTFFSPRSLLALGPKPDTHARWPGRWMCQCGQQDHVSPPLTRQRGDVSWGSSTQTLPHFSPVPPTCVQSIW